jgi:LDH2 family malate/lactate/ureidoglycolate dehydrogenase
VEARTRAARLARGIELDDQTWKALCGTAEAAGVAIPAL